MIVFRYLAREVLLSTFAVSGVLLLILVSGRFIRYLAGAAKGEVSPDVVFELMALSLPGLLELILPLGLLLGIFLGFGRLYLESEMVVLSACGISQKRLVAYVMGPALLTTALVALLSLWLAPLSADRISQILDEQKSRSQLQSLLVGRFQSHPGTRGRVSYTDNLEKDGTLGRVFLVEQSISGVPVVMVAESGHTSQEGEARQEFLVLKNGVRYEGRPGELSFTQTSFSDYGVRMEPPDTLLAVTKDSAKPTLELIGSDRALDRAQLHWRIALPMLAIIVSLMAVPLSKVNPRQGRYAKMLPSIILYLVYLTLLSTARSQVEDAKADIGLIYAVHLVFLMIALNFLYAGRFWALMLGRLTFLTAVFKRGRI
ncbi:MAG: LPS export ABC transporter permease LptF [Pontibacterium sp.]